MIDQTRYDLWWKIKQDNKVVDRIGLVYVESKMELSRPI